MTVKLSFLFPGSATYDNNIIIFSFIETIRLTNRNRLQCTYMLIYTLKACFNHINDFTYSHLKLLATILAAILFFHTQPLKIQLAIHDFVFPFVGVANC